MSRWNSPRIVETVSTGGQPTAVKFFDTNPCRKKTGTINPSSYFPVLTSSAITRRGSSFLSLSSLGYRVEFTLHIHFHLQHQEGLWKVCSVKARNIRFAGIHFRFLSQGDVVTSVKRLKTDQPSSNIMSTVSPNMPTSVLSISFQNLHMYQTLPNCTQARLFIELFSIVLMCVYVFPMIFFNFFVFRVLLQDNKNATKAACQDRGSLGSFVFPRSAPALAAYLRCGQARLSGWQEWIQSI